MIGRETNSILLRDAEKFHTQCHVFLIKNQKEERMALLQTENEHLEKLCSFCHTYW
jgi:hypothetical protein